MCDPVTLGVVAVVGVGLGVADELSKSTEDGGKGTIGNAKEVQLIAREDQEQQAPVIDEESLRSDKSTGLKSLRVDQSLTSDNDSKVPGFQSTTGTSPLSLAPLTGKKKDTPPTL